MLITWHHHAFECKTCQIGQQWDKLRTPMSPSCKFRSMSNYPSWTSRTWQYPCYVCRPAIDQPLTSRYESSIDHWFAIQTTIDLHWFTTLATHVALFFRSQCFTSSTVISPCARHGVTSNDMRPVDVQVRRFAGSIVGVAQANQQGAVVDVDRELHCLLHAQPGQGCNNHNSPKKQQGQMKKQQKKNHNIH